MSSGGTAVGEATERWPAILRAIVASAASTDASVCDARPDPMALLSSLFFPNSLVKHEPPTALMTLDHGAGLAYAWSPF